MNKVKVTALAALLTSLPLVANAGELYGGVGVGGAWVESSKYLGDFNTGSQTFEASDVAFQVFVGYQITNSVAVEFDYANWGTLEDTNVFGTGTKAKAEPQIYSLVAVGSVPLGASNFSLFGKAGVAFVNVDTAFDAGDGGGYIATDSINSEDLTLGGGIDYRMGNFRVRAEATWVNAEDTDKALFVGVSGIYGFPL